MLDLVSNSEDPSEYTRRGMRIVNPETSFAVSTTGAVYAWGGNAGAWVGNGTRVTQLTPVVVETGVSLISATAGNVVTNAQRRKLADDAQQG